MRRAARQLAVVTSIVFGLSVAVPPGAVPADGDFPLAWTWSWVRAERVWSAAKSLAGAPVPELGKAPLGIRPGDTDAKAGHGRAPKPAAGTLDAYVPYVPEVESQVAGAPSGTFDAKTSKRVAAKATGRSDEFRNADGSITRRLHSGATNYRDGDSWKPIDTTLVRRADGRWHVKANSLGTSVAATAGGETALAGLELPGGESVEYTLDGAAAVPAKVADGVATYPDVLPGTDLTLAATPAGLKETLVLDGPQAASSWLFPLDLDGLTPRLGADGGVQLRDGSGKTVAWIPPGFMADSRVDPATGLPTRSDAVTYRLVAHEGGTALRIDADRAWLTDPKRVYPVRVDPTLTTSSTGDVFVDNDPATTNQNGDFLAVGTNNGTVKARSFIHLDDLTGSAYVNKRVTTAKLTLFLTYAKCLRPMPFSVHRVTEAWTVANLTNGAYPGPAISAPIGTLTVPDATVACNNSPTGDKSTGQRVTVDLDPATFNEWSSGGANNGLALTADETDGTGYKLFDSANYASGAYEPVVDLTYTDNIAPQVSARYPANNATLSSLTPELMVRGHDPDAYPGKDLTYVYRLYDAAGTLLTTTAATRTPSWVVPAGRLGWNTTYLWSAQVSDGITSGSAPPLWAFTTSPPQNNVGSGLSQNGGKGYDPSIGNYTTSATDASVATVGPSLSITRSYNSLDTRRQNAFGAGWASVLDTRVTRTGDSVVITYPTGQEMSFGRNADGSWTPAAGRFATLKESSAGWTLTDKDATEYAFLRDAGNGVHRLTTVTDANGRKLTVAYDTEGGNPFKLTGATGRALWLTWTTPSGSTAPHVATIGTDPVVGDDWNTSETWSYSYGADDRLSQVCSPDDWEKCWRYDYDTTSRYAAAVEDLGASSHWPLSETTGAGARSVTLAQAGVDSARYNNVQLGQPGGVAGSTAGAAGFNGRNSFLKLPAGLLAGGGYQTISMWFRTSTAGGVLYSYNEAPMTSATTVRNYVPALYVGSDGRLRGQYWTGTANPIDSGVVVTDGNWHHVVLSGAGSTQSLYLDGVSRGTRSGTITRFDQNSGDNTIVGAGFVGNDWPAHEDTGKSPGEANFFTGTISDVAFFNRTLNAAAVATLRTAGTGVQPVLSKVTRPSGGVTAAVRYDKSTGKVAAVTDEHGGTWTMGSPQVVGSADAYVNEVLTDLPQDYWGLDDTSVTDAVNRTGGGNARYNSVTLGGAGPFAGARSASFNGTSSSLSLPATATPHTGPGTVEMWFKQDAAQAGGVLYGYQSAGMDALDAADDWTPALYIGTDGKLRGGFWTGAPGNVITSSGKVADGAWHHVALTSTGTAQSLYLDGAPVGSRAGTVLESGATDVLVGAGKWSGGFPGTSTATAGWFRGSLAEVAYHPAALTAERIAARKAASQRTSPVAVALVDGAVKPVPTAVSRVTVTGPGGEKPAYSYDLLNGNRIVARTDGRGYETKFAYDVGGYGSVTVDPRGIWTQNLQDVRGNTKQTITCQDQSAKKCSSVYFTYFPDATSAVLTPDARNDLLLDSRDGRSTSATDNNYRTSYGYDARGNQTSVTDPLGRVTRTAYTAGTEAAVGGGTVPAGLPNSIVTAGGITQTVRYNSHGDVAEVTAPSGSVTSYTYDGVGRKLTEKEVTDTYPNGLVTSYTYDRLGRELTETEPPVTNRITQVVHQARTTTTYDADGNVLSTTESDLTGGDPARVSSHTYTAYGQEQTETSEGGGVSRYEYDRYGRVVSETGPGGDVTRNSYDAEGNLLTTTVVGWTGDPNDPQPARDLVVAARTYDPAGRLESETEATGWTTSYLYYDNGLPARTTRWDGEENFVVEATEYDADGNETATITDNWVNRVETSYDAAGRAVSTLTDPDGLKRTTTVTYDKDDNVVATDSRDGAGVLAERADLLVDAEGNLLAETAYTSSGLTPVGRWPLAETSGSTAADSAGNNPAALGSGVTWSTDRSGSAAFNGNGAIRAGGPALDTTRSYSVAAWVKLTDTSRNRTVLAQDGNRTSGFNLQYHQSSNKWTLNVPSADADSWTGRNVFSKDAAKTNTWTHLAVTFDAGSRQLKMYVDGVADPAATTTISGEPWAARGALTIGGAKWAGGFADPWLGGLDDVQVYQQVLTDAQVTSIKNGTAPAADATVVRTSSRYDTGGNLLATTDPNGATTTYVNDENGRPARTDEALVTAETAAGPTLNARPVTWAGWNTFGEPTDLMDPLGNRSSTGYDAEGNVVVERSPQYRAPGATGPVTPEVVSEYDGSGRLSLVRDPLGNETSYSYDQLDRVSSMRAPDGGVTRYTYDVAGNLLSTVDPTGAVTQATWDYLGRPLTTTDVVRQTGKNYTTKYEYGAGGWESRRVNANGVSTSTDYDAVGDVRSSTDSAGKTTWYNRDGAGRLSKTLAPDGTSSTNEYDLTGRPTRAVDRAADGSELRSTSTRYDRAGNAVASTDARGFTSTFTYDATGLPTSERQPISASDAITTTFGYDLAGNRTRFTDGRGNAFFTTYNSLGLPESQIEPATTAHPDAADRTWTTAYDAAGRSVRQNLPGGVSISSEYTVLGQLKKQSGAGAEAATADQTFDYDKVGRMTAFSGPGGSNTIKYDDRDLPTEVSGPSGNTYYSYREDGSLTSRTDAAGTTDFGYDTAGRLSTVVNQQGQINQRYAYNTMSQVDKITYSETGSTRSFGYDTLHRLTSDELKTAGGASVAKVAYGWDANDNITSKTTTGFQGAAANTYTYDQANRLTSWNNSKTTTVYAYDKAGNRVQNGNATFTYDQRNRLLAGGGKSYAYSPRGTLRTAGGDSSTYDAFGQVITQQAGSVVRTNAYDALGRNVQAGFSYSGTANDLAADATSNYVRGLAGEVLGVASGGNNRYAWTDLHTDVVGQFKSDGAALAASRTYDPLGKVITEVGMLGGLGYQSEWTDTPTGRVNMHARWYNTETGQFDSRDTFANNPVPDSIEANRYQYGSANPLTVTDPTGHMPSFGIGDAFNVIKKPFVAGGKAVGSGASKAWNKGTSMAGKGLNWGKSKLGSALGFGKKLLAPVITKGKKALTKFVNEGKKKLSTAIKYGGKAKKKFTDGTKKIWKETKKQASKGRKFLSDKKDAAKKKLKKEWNKAKQKGAKVKASVARNTKKGLSKVNDGLKKTGKFLVEHKDTIIEIGAIGAAVGAGSACVMFTAGLGAVACVAGTAGLINVAKDGAQGDLNSVGDVAGSVGTGALFGAVGGGAGMVGLKAGTAIGGRLGVNTLKGRIASSIVENGTSSVVEQGVTTRRLDLKATGLAAVTGGGLPKRRAAGGGTTGSVAPSCKIPHSFDPRTPVLMEDGTTRPIEDVNVGDRVLATDPATGVKIGKPVTELHRNTDHRFADITVEQEDGSRAVLQATDNHPFWSQNAGRWVEAKDLKPGDSLFGKGGKRILVRSVKLSTGAAEMRDLTVADIHTYHVLAGNTQVLVHNCGQVIAGPNLGSLRVSAAKPSASEVAAAQHMAARGGNVVLRDPVGPRGSATSDLLVDGEQWDVYTPTTGNPNRIVSGVAHKGSQVLGGGVVVDLSQSSVTPDQLGNIQARIAGTGGRVGQIEVMP